MRTFLIEAGLIWFALAWVMVLALAHTAGGHAPAPETAEAALADQ
jgi:hypothetical protein